MSNTIEYIVCGSTINVAIGTEMFVVDDTHPNYRLLRQSLPECAKMGDEEKLRKLLDVVKSVEFYADGVLVKDGVLSYKDKPLNNGLTERVLELMAKGAQFRPFVRFLSRLMKNPHKHSIDALLAFMENKGLPLTEDGCILGYKNVRTNYKDWYSGTIDNSPGASPTRLEHGEVDDDHTLDCSFGYHIGTLEYAKGFHGSEGLMILTKFAPEDVVSVPSDGECGKLRVVWYTVLGDYNNKSILKDPLYSADGEPIDFDVLTNTQEELSNMAGYHDDDYYGDDYYYESWDDDDDDDEYDDDDDEGEYDLEQAIPF